MHWRWRSAAVVAAVALLAPLAVAARPGPTRQPPFAAASTDEAVACRDLRAGAMVACLHGNDTPPPGVSLFVRPTLDELEARTSLRSSSPRLRGLAGLEQATRPPAAAEPAAVSCVGNGTSGNRIQAIYARALGVPDRYATLLPSLRQWAAEADQAVWVSAGETGGGRRLRFVTDSSPSCELDVAQVLLTTVGDDSFGQMRTELQLQGFNRSDRKYLVWVDAAVGICGLGEVYGDTRPGQENYNNGGPMYARVDAPCWHYAELHEIFHNLGAVQPDAPHPSAAWHCTDEADVMCYDDDGGGPVVMTTVCAPEHEALLDCGADDYFSTDPPPGNYLASSWNTATSSFLQDDAAPRPAQLTLTGAATITYGGQASLGAQLTDEQTGDGLEGEPVNLFGRRAGTSGEQAAGSAMTTQAGAASFTPAPTATTFYRASFPGSDTHGIADSLLVTVSVRPRVSARLKASTITYGQTITVTGSVSPNHAGQRAYLQRLVSGAWKTAATATLTSGSGYTLRAKPPTRGRLTYRVYKGADTDHTSAASPNLTVTVR
ncbi:MAG TPA: hypothetical protein VK942_20150 [Actinomycetes bacterium]|nr:hypothetical protein [Actinomycetes bacterium]